MCVQTCWVMCFSSFLQLPPWQHWWWRHASSGVCAQPNLIIRRTASTVCDSTEMNMTMRFDSRLWAPRSCCLPTSTRMRVKVKRRRCMPAKSESSSVGSVFHFDLPLRLHWPTRNRQSVVQHLALSSRARQSVMKTITLFWYTEKFWAWSYRY